MLFWLQDKLGWKVTERAYDGLPIARRPRWWNLYGQRMVQRYQQHDQPE